MAQSNATEVYSDLTGIKNVLIDKTNQQSDADKSTLSGVLARLYDMQLYRSKTYPYFNDLTLMQYVDMNMKRWNGYIPPRPDITMDWQAHVFNNFTRNMVISYLSKVALAPPRAKFTATNEAGGYTDKKGSYILEKLVQYSDRTEKYEWKFFNVALESVVKGTAIGYEGWRRLRQEVTDSKYYDITTGAYDKTKSKFVVVYNDAYHQSVPLEEFYVGNIWEPNVQEQPDVIWRGVYKYQELKNSYQKYPKWEQVQPGQYASGIEDTIYYKNKQIIGIEMDQCEVIRYYNRWKDRHIVVVNGVVLYDGPIPFIHKKYPFCKTIYEPFAIDFFYGKALPDKIASDQDIINTLWNMMLDQGMMSMYKPILTSDPDELDDQILMPGVIKKVSNVNDYRVLNEVTGPDSSHFNLLNLAMKFGNDNGGQVNGAGLDFTPRGGKVSPRQIQMAEDNARRLVGLSAKLLEDYDAQRIELRAKNNIQFMTVPEKSEAILGKDDGAAYQKFFYKQVRMPNTQLEDGTNGTAVIDINEQENQPSADELDIQEEIGKILGENLEMKSVTPDYLRNLNFVVEIVSESSFAANKALMQGNSMELFNLMVNMPFSNQIELAKSVYEDFDKDPDRFITQQTPQAPGGGAVPPGGMPPGAPQPQMAGGGGAPPRQPSLKGPSGSGLLGAVTGGMGAPKR